MGKRLSSCCCFSVRTGAIIMAALGIFAAGTGLLIYSITLGVEDNIQEVLKEAKDQAYTAYLEGNMSQEEYTFLANYTDTVRKVLPYVLICGLVLAIVSFTKHLMLLLGVIYNKSCLMLPWLIIVMGSLILNSVGLVAVMIILWINGAVGSGFIALLVGLPFLGLGVYLWGVVLAVFKNIRESKYETKPFVTAEVPPAYEEYPTK